MIPYFCYYHQDIDISQSEVAAYLLGDSEIRRSDNIRVDEFQFLQLEVGVGEGEFFYQVREANPPTFPIVAQDNVRIKNGVNRFVSEVSVIPFRSYYVILYCLSRGCKGYAKLRVMDIE